MNFNMIFLSILFTLLAAPKPSFALTASPGDTLTLTVVNHSDHTLTYKNTSHTNPGNTFQLTSTEILPGASITVRANSMRWAGIQGDLTFEDPKGRRSILKIRDPLQLNKNQHLGTFAMNNTRLISFVNSQSLNAESRPENITWTEATVEIQNRLL